MNIKVEYRRYKIAGLNNQTTDYNELFDFAINNLIGLTCYQDDNFPDYLLYGKSKEELLFEYNTKTNYLCINYNKLCLIFKSKYSLNNQQINELCQCILWNAYKLKIVTIEAVGNRAMSLLWPAYKLKVVTTHW